MENSFDNLVPIVGVVEETRTPEVVEVRHTAESCNLQVVEGVGDRPRFGKVLTGD